jgi:hypothetical protein
MFHGKLPGETTMTQARRRPTEDPGLDPFSAGFLMGLLVGEGHFGGDGRQAQVVLKMHVRHAKTFQWLMRVFPESKLYGPYHHGGRHYYQWMARGPFLRREVVPLVAAHIDLLDDHVAARFRAMCERYGLLA